MTFPTALAKWRGCGVQENPACYCCTHFIDLECLEVGTYLGLTHSYIYFGCLDLDLQVKLIALNHNFIQGSIWPFLTHKETWEQEAL